MKNIKKDLILFMPSIEGGGVEKNLFTIANFFANKINKIKLITYDNTFSSNFDKKIRIIYSKKNSNSESKYHKYLVCLWLLFKQYLLNKNILVLTFQANIYCLILSRILNFDVIIRSNSSPSGWSNNFIKNFIFKFFFKYAKEIIVNSYEFKKQLDKKFNANCKVIYNPLNIKEIKKKARERLNFKFFQRKKNLNFINIARFTDQKDHLTLLNAFKNIDKTIKYKLLIMGYGINYSKILNFIEKNNLKNKIKVIKFQKNPYKYLIKSDVLVLTSIYEGLPNVILEALALKKFVISSDCPTGPKEILNYGQYGYLFKTGSIKDLKSKILKLKYDKGISNMIKKGYNSLNKFDFKKNNQKYLNIINNYL